MIKPNPETRNVIVEVYVDVPFGATLRDIEEAIENTVNVWCEAYSLPARVTDIEAKENRGESE